MIAEYLSFIYLISGDSTFSHDKGLRLITTQFGGRVFRVGKFEFDNIGVYRLECWAQSRALVNDSLKVYHNFQFVSISMEFEIKCHYYCFI